MAEKNRYPQIPSTVWWGVRSILHNSPNATIDERMLSVQLGVQPAASKAYINELKSVGILNDDCKATELAKRWRLDDTYAAAAREIVESVYPDGLLDVAPPEEAERDKVVSWFMLEGLGKGSAGNKAATYLLLASQEPNEAPRTGQKAQKVGSAAPHAVSGKSKSPKPDAGQPKSSRQNNRKIVSDNLRDDPMPLNVNVQIHIRLRGQSLT